MTFTTQIKDEITKNYDSTPESLISLCTYLRFNSTFDNHKISNYYFNMAVDMKNNGYITAGQFQLFLNYISKPAYLENINGPEDIKKLNIEELNTDFSESEYNSIISDLESTSILLFT